MGIPHWASPSCPLPKREHVFSSSPWQLRNAPSISVPLGHTRNASIYTHLMIHLTTLFWIDWLFGGVFYFFSFFFPPVISRMSEWANARVQWGVSMKLERFWLKLYEVIIELRESTRGKKNYLYGFLRPYMLLRKVPFGSCGEFPMSWVQYLWAMIKYKMKNE